MNRVLVLLVIAMSVAAARYPLVTNVASIRSIHAVAGSMERAPLGRFAANCDRSASPLISVSASQLLQGCADPALRGLQAFLGVHPADSLALGLAGDAAWQLRRLDDARTSWAAAGDYRRLANAGRYLEAIRNLGAAESMYAAAAGVPASDGMAGVRLAGLLWTQGRKQDAMRTYEAIIARDPRRGGDTAYANLATLYAEEKRFEDADRIAARGLALWPRSVALQTAVGVTYAWSGRTELAAGTLGKVWGNNPSASDACYWLGWVRARQGDDRAAVRQFSSCLARNPRDLSARYDLGLAQTRLGDLDAARSSFQAIVAMSPGHQAARDRLLELEQTPH